MVSELTTPLRNAFERTMRSPADIYALVFGLYQLLLGAAGFFVNADFAIGDDATSGELLGVFDTNGWHNTAGVAVGIAYLGGFLLGTARLVAIAGGSLLIGTAAVGLLFDDDDFILGFVASNTADDLILHLGIGVAGVAAYVASRPGRQSLTVNH